MADKTENYGLTKPTLEEFYDVNVQNENMDIIDEELKKRTPSLATYYPANSAKSADELTDPFALVPVSLEVNSELFNIVGGTFAWVWTSFYIEATVTARRMQIAMSYNTIDHKMAFRIYGANGWLEWKEIATADSIPVIETPTASEVGAIPAAPILLTSKDDLNQITTNGYYYWRTNNKPANAPTDTEASQLTAMHVWTEDSITCIQEIMDMYSGNTHSCVMRRTVDGGDGYPWEWVNPPMAIGVEYRTVERYDNEPVFVTLLSSGVVQKRTNYHGIVTPKTEDWICTLKDGRKVKKTICVIKSEIVTTFIIMREGEFIGEYKFVYGMTWRDWVNSPYNTDGYYMPDNQIFTEDDAYVLCGYGGPEPYGDNLVVGGLQYYLEILM